MTPSDARAALRLRAEQVWEELGGDLCICQRADVAHWCEKCQGRIDIILAALADAPVPPATPPEDEEELDQLLALVSREELLGIIKGARDVLAGRVVSLAEVRGSLLDNEEGRSARGGFKAPHEPPPAVPPATPRLCIECQQPMTDARYDLCEACEDAFHKAEEAPTGAVPPATEGKVTPEQAVENMARLLARMTIENAELRAALAAPAPQGETARLRAVVDACHNAIGEHEGSDDGTLAEGISLRLKEAYERIAHLEALAAPVPAQEIREKAEALLAAMFQLMRYCSDRDVYEIEPLSLNSNADLRAAWRQWQNGTRKS